MTKRMISTLGAMAFVVTTFLGALPVLAVEAKKNDDETYRLLALFGDVFERIRAEYVEPPSEEAMIESAINGMLSALDPHSSYLNAKGFKEMQVNTRGEFGGLGIQVTMENGFVKVISPIDDTPAFRAGVESGDIITHLDGESVQGMALNEAVEKMRGKVGSDIRLTIAREGREPFDISITRSVIKITSVRSRAEGKVAYVRITSFNEQTDQGLNRAIEKLREEIGKDMEGVVLDLRNNPGGLLDQAVAVSDAFLNRGEIVSTRSRKPEDTQRFNAREGDLAEGLPVVVLINGGSASASEIVAGALQDHHRAIILGTKSFGKGSVQTIMPLPGNGAMRLTTARYYTPSGRSIQAKGVEPDILVNPAKFEEVVSTRPRRSEADLRGALDTEGKEKAKDKDKETVKPEDSPVDAEAAKDEDKADAKAPQDYQLTRALDLIHGLSILSKNAAAQ